MAEEVTFLLRRGLSTGATGWTALNPILSAGEPGFEINTSTLKIGDGTATWNNLDTLRFGDRVAIGDYAGNANQGSSGVAIGRNSGQSLQGNQSTAVGGGAGAQSQGGTTGGAVALGYFAGELYQKEYAVAIGYEAAINKQGAYSIAIGSFAGNSGGQTGVTFQANNTTILNATGNFLVGVSGQTGSFYVAPVRNDSTVGASYSQLRYNMFTNEITYDFTVGQKGQQQNPIAIGVNAGQTGQGLNSVAIGSSAGQTGQGLSSVAIGNLAGQTGQGKDSVAIGTSAGQTGQFQESVAIGNLAGSINQQQKSVAIGSFAGETGQGSSSIAIGYLAGQSNQEINTIILNSTGAALNSQAGITGCCYVAPIRNVTLAAAGPTFSQLWYNKITKEIVWN
jgi:hypothetical protein